MTTRSGLIRALAAAALVTAAACGEDDTSAIDIGAPLEPGEVVTANAVVVRAGIESPCWSLMVPGRGIYHPGSLPEDFQRPHLAVRMTMRAAPGAISHCPGPIVSLDNIARR